MRDNREELLEELPSGIRKKLRSFLKKSKRIGSKTKDTEREIKASLLISAHLSPKRTH